ncbi:MAG: replication-relaxation family protein [Actinomycetota bacterium]
MTDFISDTDRDILDALVEHRVATTAHLSALLEIPERTVRYRLAQLRNKGYARAVRPPADRGSAPDHWCPTRKADSWAKGEHRPHGGDHRAPSTTFVEHSAAITALCVALKSAVGLQLVAWAREAAAAEEFEWRAHRRKIVPDALIVVADRDAEYRGFIEVDLGSMSMTRLSQKLSGYAAYYAAQAWTEAHPFPPVLLLVTTSEARAEVAIRRFEQRWTQAQRHLGSSPYLARKTPAAEIGACSAARSPEDAISDPVWLSSGGSDGLYLTDLLRPVSERWAEHQRKRREQEQQREQWRAGLAADPECCRAEIKESGSSRDFEALSESFDDNDCLALKLLLHRRQEMDELERAAFSFFSARLGWSRRGALTALDKPPPPNDEERRLAQSLAAQYLDKQKSYIARLHAQCPQSAPLRDAIDHLDQGGLLRADEITRLPGLAAAHRSAASDQLERRRAYLSWRALEVEKKRMGRRALSRLVFDCERAAHELDLEHLWLCTRCRQVVVPTERTLPNRTPPECCVCSVRAEIALPEALRMGIVRPDEDGFWDVRHLPVPAWVTKEAQRPLVQSARMEEEWWA